ncbi:MAG: PEP/pyruvate-binding domain-containing protein, partial [Caldiserica bacterium]|nr:PEP/pyruvate-binding domain-containing protein [Caldisericota bacterium]
IQEVVGRRAGKYFFPLFAGVAFSHNEFRWSPRIKREDGIVRMVMGLGTRAVDRLINDYPFLFSPGQPNLRVNVSPDEVLKYSQKKVDLINLERRRFESVPVENLIHEVAEEIPNISFVVSIFQDEQLFQPVGNFFQLKEAKPVLTFNKLISQSPFVPQIRSILKILEESLGFPVDVEFACDGDLHKIYLLQCRPQSISEKSIFIRVPDDLSSEEVIFTANKYVSTGLVSGIEFVVFVDPDAYNSISSYEELLEVGRVIGTLNSKLPKKKFILIGPGRWGSRGDVKLGVKVSYSQINNTAMLIEIARKKQDYVPELSFGTHFFQDLVEAQIRYLPLYPEDPGVVFNQEFFLDTPNEIKKLLPEIGSLEKVVRLINVCKTKSGGTLKIIMDGEKDKAVGLIDKK